MSSTCSTSQNVAFDVPFASSRRCKCPADSRCHCSHMTSEAEDAVPESSPLDREMVDSAYTIIEEERLQREEILKERVRRILEKYECQITMSERNPLITALSLPWHTAATLSSDVREQRCLSDLTETLNELNGVSFITPYNAIGFRALYWKQILNQ